MPTGIVEFDTTSWDILGEIGDKLDEIEELTKKKKSETDPGKKDDYSIQLSAKRHEVDSLRKESIVTRDIRTALNEYAPGQTVVINEKNFTSAGIILRGNATDLNTQLRYIFHCKNCGATKYLPTITDASGKTLSTAHVLMTRANMISSEVSSTVYRTHQHTLWHTNLLASV